jgi:hypothetical protein
MQRLSIVLVSEAVLMNPPEELVPVLRACRVIAPGAQEVRIVGNVRDGKTQSLGNCYEPSGQEGERSEQQGRGDPS